MRAHVVAIVAFLAATACGLSVTGSGAMAIPAEAGSSTSSTSSTTSSSGTVEMGDAGVSDADAHEAPDAYAILAPPKSAPCPTGGTVRRCFDFDSSPSKDPPDFGFMDIVSTGGGAYLKADLKSSLVLGAGKAFSIAIDDPLPADHQGYGLYQFQNFDQLNHVMLDVDITIESTTFDYAILAGFRVLGGTCGEVEALALKYGSLQYIHDGTALTVRGYELGVPFHLRVDTHGRHGTTGTTTIELDGVPYGTSANAWADDCTSGQALIGAWYTSQHPNEALKLQYDQIVLRGE